jgi:hypothetical protein
MKLTTTLDNIENAVSMLRNFSNQVEAPYQDLYTNIINMLDVYIANLIDDMHDEYQPDDEDIMDMMCLDAENKQLKENIDIVTKNYQELQNIFVEVEDENEQLRQLNIQLQLQQDLASNYKRIQEIVNAR